jgi:hypothetical protein
MLVIWLLIPLAGICQTKNVINSTRVFSKPDKVAEFKKALAAHAQKYHTGDWKWRVWTIESGPDAGGYMITEGPNSWDRLDGREDISAEHTADWDKNVSPLTEGQGSQSYMEFQEDLSTVQITDYASKILVNHMIIRPGRLPVAADLIKKLKKAWEAGNESVAVYSGVGSGDPAYITVTRLKQGFKEMAEGFRKPLRERFDTANGAGSYDAFAKEYADVVERRWSELLVFDPALSSK